MDGPRRTRRATGVGAGRGPSPDPRAARARRRRRGLGLALALLAAGLLVGALLPAHPHPHARTAAASRSSAGGAPTSPPAATRGAPARPLGYPESSSVRALTALGRPIYCAGRSGNEVALTFDDGPGPYTRLVIAKLRKHHVGATFFDVGRNLALAPGTPRQERELGAVGDHTFTHPLLTSLAPAAAASQIVRTKQALARASGGPVFLFRPPYGGHDSTVDAIARGQGLLQVLWSVDSADSLGASYSQIEHNVIAGMRPGAIILMHENHGQTVRAMIAIFAALKRKHLRAVSVPQLLTDDPPSPAQVLAGGRGCGVPRGRALSGG